MRNKITFFLFVLAVLSICGCRSQNENTADSLKIGVAYYDKTDTFIGELLDLFKDEVAKSPDDLQISVSFRDADGSQRTQNSQVEELISEDCNVLLVNLVDRANPSQIINNAQKAGIPVIFFNREPVDEDLFQWDKLYYIGADAKQSGVLQGELAAKYIIDNPSVDKNGDGKLQYVILEGEPGHQDAIIRTEAVIETLTNQGIEIEKISHAIANWSRPQAKNRMGQLIREYKDSIELVLGNNDDMAIGAYEAYEGSEILPDEMPVFFGIDGTDVGLNAVRDGILTATVYNDKEGQAAVMANLAITIAKGESLDKIRFSEGKSIYLPYSSVDLKNVETFKQ